eukprot:6853074-Prymnesium_polylepis.2
MVSETHAIAEVAIPQKTEMPSAARQGRGKLNIELVWHRRRNTLRDVRRQTTVRYIEGAQHENACAPRTPSWTRSMRDLASDSMYACARCTEHATMGGSQTGYTHENGKREVPVCGEARHGGGGIHPALTAPHRAACLSAHRHSRRRSPRGS